MIVVDAENKIMGRLAAKVAEKAKAGDEVAVVNSEKAVISGDKDRIKADYKQKKDRGGRHTGPHFPKSPDRILKRAIKNMLPKNRDGRDDVSRVKTYIGVPDGMEPEEIDVKEGNDLQHRNYVKLGDVSRHIGWVPVGER